MPRQRLNPGLLVAALALAAPGMAHADLVVFHGKVVMEDGAIPGRVVGIQRTCDGMDHPIREAIASPKTGLYIVRLDVSDFGGVFSGGVANSGLLPCVLEATAQGFASSKIDLTDRRTTMNPQLPDIVLRPVAPGALLNLDHGPGVPRAASRPWAQALKAMNVQNWAAAETPLHSVVENAPAFAPGWTALGAVCGHLAKPEEARKALERAIELDPKPLAPYLLLGEAEMDLKDWDAAARTSAALIQADSKRQYLDAYIQNAVAHYQAKDFDGALARINETIKLDKRREYPRAEYILGVILEARHEYDAAAEHMRAYLREHPRAKDAASVAERLANLGKSPPADLAAELTTADMRLPASGEAPVPGGVKAFAAIARLPETPQDFFLEYCRAIAATPTAASNPTLEARESVRVFISTVGELEQLGQRQDDRTVIRLSLDSDGHRQTAERVLTLLGWRLRQSGDSYDVEPGDLQIDGYRQRLPALFGIDELEMREAIAAQRPFQFEIPLESARLVGGAAWNVALKGLPGFTGGPAEIFIRDQRFARVYSGLAAMEPETASAVVSGIGLATLINNYSVAIADYSEALVLDGSRVSVPGGEKAQAVWSKLAGAGPQNPVRFFRALFEKDQGRLLTFYFDLWRADAAHQQFFTASGARAEAFYKWYRDSAALAPLARGANRWQAVILQRLRLDAANPEAILAQPSLEPLAAALQLEARRGKRLDGDSIAILTHHFEEWRHVFPYFEKLPGLAAPEFSALADFTDEVAKAPAARQAVLVGDWHSLVELIVLGSQAGSLDAAQAARAFRQVCEALRSANPSAGAIAALREMAGGAADVDEAVASRLLKLAGARRDAFEHVKELQDVPRINTLGQTPDARKTLAALSGVVYAALLDPRYLLVVEDRKLLAKHNFLPLPGDKRSNLFADSALIASNTAPGSFLVGGFGRFQEVTRNLDRSLVDPGPIAEPAADPPALDEAPPSAGVLHVPAAPVAPLPPVEAIFRANARMVEVYATVTDRRGRYVDDLKAGDFTILENGSRRPVFAFENRTNSVTVALLFDTTGSMEDALPSLKAAALQLIGDLRPEDTVAVYGFNDRVTELQPFTTDKTAARRAVLRAHASGTTALYDALLRVDRDLAQRGGKKVIIVFTDGDDNASMLTADAAVLRAKARGIPIYTIAEGEALARQPLVGQLAAMSHATGGTPFLIRKLSDIGEVFRKMSEDLMHGYLLAFQPDPGSDHGWRKIEVVLTDGRGRTVRAREGYYPE